MSGGHFDYLQYQITEAAEDVDRMIRDNCKENSWGEAPGYSEATLFRFKEAAVLFRTTAIFMQRIDWLVSGDDSEDTFHERLEEEIEKYCEEIDNA